MSPVDAEDVAVEIGVEDKIVVFVDVDGVAVTASSVGFGVTEVEVVEIAAADDDEPLDRRHWE